MMLILSGVPDLIRHIDGPSVAAQQLRPLLHRVKLPGIRSKKKDKGETLAIVQQYCDILDMTWGDLETEDFAERLAFAANNRWGLVIEFVIAALVICRSEGRSDLTAKDFARAFADKTGHAKDYTPFTVDRYEDCFDMTGLGGEGQT